MGSNNLKVGQNFVVVKDHTNKKKYEHRGNTFSGESGSPDY